MQYPVYAQENASIDELTETLYELGFFSAFAENAVSTIQDIVLDLTSDQNDEIFSSLILDAFEKEAFASIIRESLRRNILSDHAQRSIEHLSEPDVARLMSNLYNTPVDFDDPDTARDFELFVTEIEAGTTNVTERAEVISEILRRSQSVRITVQTLEDVLTILVFTLNQLNPEDQQISDREVNSLIISLRNNFRQLFDNIMLYITLYSTKDTEIDTLRKHQAFLESHAGVWYVRTYNNAILNGFGEVSEKVGQSLAAWLLENSEIKETE
ncbi:MAG: hypothetical protein LAT67_09790 [Balneolales bacterium]|nr:hypothetical protein [Balneolales bacterium]